MFDTFTFRAAGGWHGIGDLAAQEEQLRRIDNGLNGVGQDIALGTAANAIGHFDDRPRGRNRA